MLSKAFEHRRAQDMSDIEHDRVRSPAFNKGLQLILEVFRLLACEPRHGIRAAKPLPVDPMTGSAIIDLGLQLARRYGSSLLCAARQGRSNYKNRCEKQARWIDVFHDAAATDLTAEPIS